MKALAVRPPFAWSIIFGGKDIENRSQHTAVRGRVLVYATQSLRIDDYGNALDLLDAGTRKRFPTIDAFKVLAGHLVGSVEIADSINHSKSKWYVPGGPAWILEKPLAMRPLAYKPMSGAVIWHKVDDNLISKKHLRNRA